MIRHSFGAVALLCRDLAELRLLDQEVFGLDTQLQSSHAERQVVVDEQANAQIAELEHAQVLSIE